MSGIHAKEAFGVCTATVWRIRRRFLTHGLGGTLKRQKQPERPEESDKTVKRVTDVERGSGSDGCDGSLQKGGISDGRAYVSIVFLPGWCGCD